MTERRLGMGDAFPDIALDDVGDRALRVPTDMGEGYKIILFYRGYWCPFCRRQLLGFKEKEAELRALGASVLAASVDPHDKAKEVADEVPFPVAFGATREIGSLIGAYWEERRGLIQPSEFILGKDNRILACSYSDGPLGRIDAADVVAVLGMYESARK